MVDARSGNVARRGLLIPRLSRVIEQRCNVVDVDAFHGDLVRAKSNHQASN